MLKSSRRDLPSALWLLWLAAATAFTANAAWWQISYFRVHAPRLYDVLPILLPCSILALAFYLRLRRRNVWRYEPVVIAVALAVALLVYAFLAALFIVWMLTACYALGRRLLRVLQLEPGPPQRSIPICASIGFAALDAALFLSGLAHLYRWWWFALLLAAPCILLYRDARALPADLVALWKRWTSAVELREPIAGLAVAWGAAALLPAAMVALTPSIAFDATHMHLLSARWYVEQGALTPVPDLDYSYFPQGAEVLMAMSWALGGQPAAQLISPLFFALTALLALHFAGEAGAAPVGALVGVVGAVTMPVLHWTGAVTKNDLVMTLFELAALACFLSWTRDGKFRWIPAGVFLLGAAFGVKHTALYGAIPLAGMFAYAVWKQRRRLRPAAGLALIFVASGLYWHARTFLLKGNPLYPESTHRVTEVHGSARFRKGSATLQAAAQFVVAAQRILLRGQGMFESPLLVPLGIFLAVCWPVWWLAPNRRIWRGPGRFIAIFVGVYFLYWAWTHPIPRYAIPALLLIFLLTGAQLCDFAEKRGLVVRASVLFAIAWCAVFALMGIAIIEVNLPAVRFLARQIGERTYLEETSASWDSFNFLAHAAAPGDRVLGLDLAKDLYSPRSIRITGFIPAHPGQLPDGFVAALRGGDYEWLAVPRTAIPAALSVSGAPALSIRHEGPNFTVYHNDQRTGR